MLSLYGTCLACCASFTDHRLAATTIFLIVRSCDLVLSVTADCPQVTLIFWVVSCVLWQIVYNLTPDKCDGTGALSDCRRQVGIDVLGWTIRALLRLPATPR